MREIPVNLSQLDQIISKQYEDKIRGFAKDSMQNSWEARRYRKRGTGFKMGYEFFPVLDGYENVLMFEDSSTVGLTAERWKAFHSHWFTTKSGSYDKGIGRWGQGKTLYLYLSSTNRILTESVDCEQEKYRYSVRTNEGYLQLGDMPQNDDPDWMRRHDGGLKLIEDFFPSASRLNHIGTRIWILDVREELVEEIINGNLTKQLSESWWEIIRDYGVHIEVKIHHSDTASSEKVGLPQFPPPEDSIEDKTFSIGSGHGKIKKLKIVLAKAEVTDTLRGIAIQRGGMAVCRYPLPYGTPEDIRRKTHGYCLLDEDLDKEMWEIELANHEGFEAHRGAWVKLRNTIDEIAGKLVEKYSKEKKITPPPIEISDIIKTVNKLVEEHLEGLGRGGKGNDGGGGGGKSLPDLYISPWGYIGTDRRFDPGDIMEVSGAVGNKTTQQAVTKFVTWIEDDAGQIYWTYLLKRLRLDAQWKRKLNIPDIDLSAIGLSKGKYRLKAKLTNIRGSPYHERAAIFYFQKNPPVSGGWLRKLTLASVGGPKKGWRNLPINSKGELLINTIHPEIETVWNSDRLAKKEKLTRIKDSITNICLHEATKEVSLKWWQDPEVTYDVEEIKRVKIIFDEMWADYIRAKAV